MAPEEKFAVSFVSRIGFDTNIGSMICVESSVRPVMSTCLCRGSNILLVSNKSLSASSFLIDAQIMGQVIRLRYDRRDTNPILQ